MAIANAVVDVGGQDVFDLDVDAGVQVSEEHHDLRDQGGCQGRQSSKAQLARVAAEIAGEVGASLLVGSDHLPCHVREDSTVDRECHLASGALEESSASQTLDLGNGAAQGGLGDQELLGSAGETACPGHSEDGS